MAILKIDGIQSPLPSFGFPFIAAAPNPAKYLDPPYPTEELPSFTLGVDPTPNPAKYLDPPYPTEELPSFTLGVDPTPNPIVAFPVEPLPGGAGDPGYGFGMSG